MSTSGMRQRKKGDKNAPSQDSAFSQHVQNDSALQQQPNNTDEEQVAEKKGLTIVGRLTVFLGFPTFMGLLALYLGYMRSKKAGSTHTVDFDTDFVFPFLVSLCIVIVVGFQTKGFSTTETSPLVAWPKVRRKKKIIHKRVIVEDDEVVQEEKDGSGKTKRKATRKEE